VNHPLFHNFAAPLPEDFGAKMKIFSDLLLEWNRTHNLSGATTENEVMAQVFDSVYPLDFLACFESVLDIGSGAGFPAIPLAAARPHAHFVLVEPTKKRIAFLNFVAIKLGLKNITLEDKRIEQMPSRHYDLITSKAVMSASRLYTLSQSMMADETVMVLYKGRNTDDETAGIPSVETIDAEHSRYLLIRNH